MFFNGIDFSYRVWYRHGENGPSGGFSNVSQQHYDKCKYNDVVDTIDMVNVSQVNCMNDPQVFGRLLEDAEKPLYLGCMKYTKLSALVKLYNLKARYGWSDKGFSKLLQVLEDMLPLNNEMSLPMYEAKKTFSALGMEYQKIHACFNDCIWYRNQYKDAIACLTCGKSRWKINNEGRKIKKGFLQRFFGISHQSLDSKGCSKPQKSLNILCDKPRIKNMTINYATHQTPQRGN